MEQNQSSAPWLRPPNTLCNTDGWRRTRKSIRKITVRSAKKQERLKKHGTQNQSATGFDLETPSLPSLLTQDVTHWDTSALLPPRALPSPHLPHLTPLLEVSGSSNQSVTQWPPRARWSQHGGGSGGAEGHTRGSWCWVCCHLRVCGRQRDVSTDKTSWLLSWLQWKCLRLSPSAALLPPRRGLINFTMLFTWDSDGMFEVFKETRRGRRERTSAEAAQ